MACAMGADALGRELPGSDDITADDIVRLARQQDLKARRTTSSYDRLPAAPLPALAARPRRQLLHSRPLQRRQGAGASRHRRRRRGDGQGRVRGDLGRHPRLRDAPRHPDGFRPAVRHLLVHARDLQVSQPAEPGPARLVLPADLRADLALVLPGGGGQGAGPSRHDDARRAADRPRHRLDLRDRAGRAAHLRLLAHHQPHRRRAGRAPVPPPGRAAARLFRRAPRRRFGRPRARAGERPPVHHRLQPHAGDRPVLHRGLHRGDGLVQLVADRHRAGVAADLCRHQHRLDAAVPRAGSRRSSSAARRTRPSWWRP